MNAYENLYGEFLDEVVGCSKNAFGNRPCDCGTLCDKCNDYKEIWEEWKKSRK